MEREERWDDVRTTLVKGKSSRSQLFARSRGATPHLRQPVVPTHGHQPVRWVRDTLVTLHDVAGQTRAVLAKDLAGDGAWYDTESGKRYRKPSDAVRKLRLA